MPVETLFPSSGGVSSMGVSSMGVSSMPFRLLTKGPAYFRRPLAEPGARKLSAVERLEADKAKYVKSQQVALTRQAPVKPPHCAAAAAAAAAAGSPKTPIIRKPLLTPPKQGQIATPPARKVPRRPITAETGVGGGGGGGSDGGTGGRRGPALNLDILNNLINNVSGVAHTPTSRSSLPSCSSSSSTSSSSSPSSSSPSPSGSSPSSGTKSIGSSLSAEPHLLLLNNLKPLNTSCSTSSSKPLNTSSSKPLNTSSSLSSSSTSSPLNNRNNNNQPPPVPVRAPRVATPPYPHPHPHPMAVRRVDVRPHAALRTFPPRPALPLKPLPRQTAQPQAPPTLPPPPHRAPCPSPSRQTPQAPPPPYPPPSPAFTRLSSASSRGSSRKHPALHRSKSDLSDRYSRAPADLERFFNYCGLAPGEVEALGGVERFARANSDIVSKLHSVSTPSSEGEGGEGGEGGGGGGEEGGGGGGGGEGEGPARGGERAPYGISVIERNARVIKWLYGIRQARDVSNV